MNKCEFIGRVSREVEIRIAGETPVARFGLAVPKRFKKDGEPDADFINCVAFGKTAEILEKYVNKGSQIGISARVQCGNYTNKDGIKVYTTDFVVEELDLLGKKESGESTGQSQQTSTDSSWMNVPEGIMEDLPFN
jgi:single-strand DNA-binding protein